MWFSKAKEGAAESEAPSAGARSAARPKARRRATATSHSDWGEKYIAGVPARIMRPRLVFLSCLIAICMFGLLMIYSASSVESLQENGSSWFFLYRQAIFMFIGFVLFAMIGSRLLPWPLFRSKLVWGVWVGVLVLLIAVLFVGQGAEEWGASRWIDLGIFNLQPAEVAKPVIIVLTAKIFADYFEDGTIDTRAFLIQMLIMLPFPLFLIFREPDLGTTIIIALTVFAIAILCGLPWRVVAFVTIAAFVLGAAAIVTSPYRAKRFLAFLDPWSDPYDTGYQATLAIMAFASGGLFGRGIGNSTMKYHYLPEAHNDYILAIIGEELGFVGTAIFVLVFVAMIIAAFYICREAPTLHAQLLASGCTIILAVQFLINVFGILGVMPMTGKPLPFVSYGGSSIIASLVLAALIFRVSVESNVETAADRRRSGMAVMGERSARAPARRSAGSGDDVSGHIGRSTAGEARVRSTRRDGSAPRADRAASSRSALSVYDGGRQGRSEASPTRREPRGTAGGYGRIDLGSDAGERLRPRQERPRVDYRGVTGGNAPRRSGDGRPPRGMNDWERGRYDR
ncbi:putative lipid II flippase FtsW [Collinsella intestinalis]|uniref:putative lipid II flippase FtsW n=1 Tax=Collinsella intestinalis TaxID=147207 RepID=UPI002420006A|nr:putative lipid II flippase FtsW [Collinsella intestinalis]